MNKITPKILAVIVQLIFIQHLIGQSNDKWRAGSAYTFWLVCLNSLESAWFEWFRPSEN